MNASRSFTCPVCSAQQSIDLLVRHDVPVHQNLPFVDPGTARAIRRADLHLRFCMDCTFVWNALFDEACLSYNEHYDNAQWHSPAFMEHMRNRARYMLDTCRIRGKRIAEVGCGQGTFLSMLVESPTMGNTGIGYDPSYAGPALDPSGRVRFVRDYYSESASADEADVVVCRHVIEHVPRPLDFLTTVGRALGNSPDALLFFETPCVGWILRNEVVWDLFYEHCSLFSPISIRVAMDRAGFGVRAMQHLFGGQYLWIEACAPGSGQREPPDTPLRDDLRKAAESFTLREATVERNWRQFLTRLAGSGKVALWGAGAKGVTLVNMIDPSGRIVDCIIDINPGKQGKFAPGTGHAIVDPRTATERGVRCAVVLNPNYLGECAGLVEQAGGRIQLITEPSELP